MPDLSQWTDEAVSIAVIIVIAVLLRWATQHLITRIVRVATERANQHLARLGNTGRTAAGRERQVARTRTLGSLLGSTATVVIGAIALLMVLDELGVNLAPLLTSAGVGGVALAFGAQSLVKDVISGVFLIMEDQFGVGDTITANDVTGTVENVGLRTTSVRDGNGMLWYLRNGEITRLGNVSQGWSMATVDVLVAPDEDPVRAMSVLRTVCDEITSDEATANDLIEPPTVLGVETITATAMTIRLSAKCAPNKQWGIQRDLRERTKRALDEAGVRGPASGWGTPTA